MNTKIMMIDDDPDFVAGIKSILEKADYSVNVAYNPKDGFQALQAEHYDLLLLDIMMGRGAEGIALARKIRKDPKRRRLPGPLFAPNLASVGRSAHVPPE